MPVKFILIVIFGLALVLAEPIPDAAVQTNILATAISTTNFKNDDSRSNFESFMRSIEVELQAEEQTDLIDANSERSLEDTWMKLRRKWESIINKAKARVHDFVAKGKNVYQIVTKHLPKLKVKMVKLIDDVKKTYREIVIEGKDAGVEMKSFYETLKEAYEELKLPALQVYDEFRDFVKDIRRVIEIIHATVGAIKYIG